MSNTQAMTYRRVGRVLQEIGMVSEEKVRSVLKEAENYADEEVDQYEAACALEEFGVAVSVHADDIDSIHEDYAALLTDALAVAGDRVTITDVRLVEGDGELENGRFDTLEFRRNGKPVSISAEHFADDYFDHQAACEAIDGTADADDPRSWCEVDFERKQYAGYDTVLVLATPEQAAALQEHLGFTWNLRGCPGLQAGEGSDSCEAGQGKPNCRQGDSASAAAASRSTSSR
ncbi:hypothetical protein [Streptomyces meridianus]|uniref:Uncharacterized protein n=1 Tax=Streptomyces meridianus TaxID=2938945 RepID=A0ABT0X3P3_9ACTN|nr:hypothetical protein [Streptomyces meridianus]MCM2576287.1 hypothetical protein [Streptomyces meridianus]